MAVDDFGRGRSDQLVVPARAIYRASDVPRRGRRISGTCRDHVVPPRGTRRVRLEHRSADVVKVVAVDLVVCTRDLMRVNDRLPRPDIIEAVPRNYVIPVRVDCRQIDDAAKRSREVLERVSLDQRPCAAETDSSIVIIREIGSLDRDIRWLPYIRQLHTIAVVA